MLDVATYLQLCRITSATLVSQEYHKTIQTSRGSEAVLQEKYRFFKKSPPFYRNLSVTKSPKALQLCCASRQNQPSATGSAHFWGRSSASRYVYFCIYMHLFAYHGFCVRFCSALRCSPLRPLPMESKPEPLCSARHSRFFIKKHKKEAAAQKCTTASHNSGYAIEVRSGTGDHRAAFAASICLMSSGTTLNRSPTMP